MYKVVSKLNGAVVPTHERKNGNSNEVNANEHLKRDTELVH